MRFGGEEFLVFLFDIQTYDALNKANTIKTEFSNMTQSMHSVKSFHDWTIEEIENYKEIFERKRQEIIKDIINVRSNNFNSKINLNLNFEEIVYNEEQLSLELLNEINFSIEKAKLEFEKKWKDYLKTYGVEF